MQPNTDGSYLIQGVLATAGRPYEPGTSGAGTFSSTFTKIGRLDASHLAW